MHICYLISETERLPLLDAFLHAGFDVTLGATRQVDLSVLPGKFALLPKCFVQDSQKQRFDAAVASDWRSVLDLFYVDTQHPVILLERFWHESLAEDDPAYTVAKSSLHLPAHFLTTNQYVDNMLQQICSGISHAYLSYPRSEALQQNVADQGNHIIVDSTANPVYISSLLAVGTPVITLVTPETETLIEHNVNGLLVDVEDLQALDQLKNTVEQDRQLMNKLVTGARVMAERMPSLEETSKRLCRVFAEEFSQPACSSLNWLGEFLRSVYQQSVFLHEVGETSREELHTAQKRENDAQRELAEFKRKLEADRLYRYMQKVRRKT